MIPSYRRAGPGQRWGKQGLRAKLALCREVPAIAGGHWGGGCFCPRRDFRCPLWVFMLPPAISLSSVDFTGFSRSPVISFATNRESGHESSLRRVSTSAGVIPTVLCGVSSRFLAQRDLTLVLVNYPHGAPCLAKQLGFEPGSNATVCVPTLALN